MPEYLSPGVYVEEVDRGPRPIEGVSTSTTGMVGVTERGPFDVPIFVSSYGEFVQYFGGHLAPALFAERWQLPLAVQGFFRNGGKRLWIVKVGAASALPASLQLMDQGSPTGFAATLVSRAQPGEEILVVDDATGLVAADEFRLEDGAATEYLEAAAPVAIGTRAIGLTAPAYATYVEATPGEAVTVSAVGGANAFAAALEADAFAGATQIRLDALPGGGAAALAAGELLQIGTTGTPAAEVFEIASVPTDPADRTVQLRYPLARTHATGDAVERMEATAPVTLPALSRPLRAGDGLVVLDAASGGPTAVRFIDAANPAAMGYHAALVPVVLALRSAATSEHPAGTLVNGLIAADDAPTFDQALTADAAGGTTELALPPASVAALAVDMWLRVFGVDTELAQIAAVEPTGVVTLRQPLRFDHPGGDTARAQTITAEESVLFERLRAGGRAALAAETATGWVTGHVVQFGAPLDPGYEYHEIASTATGALVPLPATGPVTAAHLAGIPIATRADLFVVRALDAGGWGNDLAVTVGEEERPEVDTVVAAAAVPGADVSVASATGVAPGVLLELIDVSGTLAAYARPAGAEVIDVDGGAGIGGGDWIRIGRRDPEVVLVAAPGAGPGQLRLARPLDRDHLVAEAVDRMGPGGLPRMAKVDQRIGLDQVRFDSGGLPFPVGAGWVVRSREFWMTIELVRRNPRAPALERIDATETFRHLTLDSRHSSYVGTIVGLTDGPIRIWDRRTEGQSMLVRIEDPLNPAAGPDDTQATIRTAPDLVTEPQPGGRRRPVRRRLLGGIDDVAAIDANRFIGQDNVDPVLRTGIQALRNIEDISLVGVPGIVDLAVQTELVNHCELERYRFAVLDGVPGTQATGATIPELLADRQGFDTRYAALYAPWLLVRDPFAATSDAPALVLAPTGHMLGVYANTDARRGVHKAPANETIGGILGFQRVVTKAEHDLLNPTPVNINVLRDFRANFRGLRSFGARVITSDPSWRYVNVRRLFIFLERSLDLGTQWVTFEPNDPDLWARIRRSVSDFLTLVWQSGALMGTTVEEAFYVICDETTNDQATIDAGRVVVEIGVAPVKPAEFVIIRIGQWQGGSTVDEV